MSTDIEQLSKELRDIADAWDAPVPPPITVTLRAAADALEREHQRAEALQRAKSENDERFMNERDEARAERDAAVQRADGWRETFLDLVQENKIIRLEKVRVEDERDRYKAAIREAVLYCENQGDKFRHHAQRLLGLLSAALDTEKGDGEPTARELLDAIYDPEEDDLDDSVRFGFVVEQYERLRGGAWSR